MRRGKYIAIDDDSLGSTLEVGISVRGASVQIFIRYGDELFDRSVAVHMTKKQRAELAKFLASKDSAP
jgi:hypothetical protein